MFQPSPSFRVWMGCNDQLTKPVTYNGFKYIINAFSDLFARDNHTGVWEYLTRRASVHGIQRGLDRMQTEIIQLDSAHQTFHFETDTIYLEGSKQKIKQELRFLEKHSNHGQQFFEFLSAFQIQPNVRDLCWDTGAVSAGLNHATKTFVTLGGL